MGISADIEMNLRQLKRQNAPVEAVKKILEKRRSTIPGACWELRRRYDAETVFRAFCVLLDRGEIKWTGGRDRTQAKVWRAA